MCPVSVSLCLYMIDSTILPVQITFRLSLRDVYKANVAIAVDEVTRTRTIVGLVVVELLAIAGFVGFLLGSKSLLSILAGIGVALYFPIMVSFLCFIRPYFAAKSLFNDNSNLQGELHWSFSDDIVSVQMPTGRSELLWASFVKAIERGELFLLYVRKGLAYPILKRAFASDAEIAAFRELLRCHVARTSLSRRPPG